MSQINVDTVRNRTSTNGGPTFDKGLTVSAGTTAYVYGNLQVDGTETIVNTERLDVADKTVGIASTTSASNSTADGAGIEVYGGSDGNKTITWVNSTSNWTLGGGGLTADSAIVGSAVTINGSGIKAGIITANTASFIGDVDIADTIVHTGDTNTKIRFPAADTITAETSGSERLRIDSSGNVGLGNVTAAPTSSAYNAGTLHIHQATGGASGGSQIKMTTSQSGSAAGDGAYLAYYGNNELYIYNKENADISFGTNATERLRITKTGGLSLDNGELIERCYINSTAWSTNGDINLDNGMVQYNSANLAGTNNTLNITSSVGINTQMATGDMISVTCITAVNATTAYVNHITIDHIAVTENWVGGSAPTDGGGSGLDTYAFNIIKTGSAAWKVIANQVKTS